MSLDPATVRPARFQLHVGQGGGQVLHVTGPAADGRPRRGAYPLDDRSPRAYAALLSSFAQDFGSRLPKSPPAAGGSSSARFRPVLVDNLTDRQWYGYGDPCVLRAEGASGDALYYLVVTSNDAPDSFPIFASSDLLEWRAAGFAFPQGAHPAWTMVGEGRADFWAPELHQAGDEFWLCFAARDQAGQLSIGLARSGSPDGPFSADPAPILGGGVIDPHLHVAADGRKYLFWKSDSNDGWPSRLAALLRDAPHLVDRLFADPASRRTADLAAALSEWISELPPMEAFGCLHTLIEAVSEDLPRFVRGLVEATETLPAAQAEQARQVVGMLETRIFAQELSPDGRSLLGEPVVVLVNDQWWEGHLVEGMWVSRVGGRYYMFYSANDFSNADYGLGVAVADHVFGPYRKATAPLLRSTPEWWGPGHASLAWDREGQAQLFFHAFPAGLIGYKAFRALLRAPLCFLPDTAILAE